MDQNRLTEMERWKHVTHFMGFDWAKSHHAIVLLDGSGRIVVRLRIDQTAEGWHRLHERLTEAIGSSDLSLIEVAIETNCGPAVERLLELNCLVYPLNPKAAQRYRDRKAPSGTKTDDLDAWSFADALRTDGHGWKVLKPEDSLIQKLRLMCRDEVGLIEQRTAFVNQLQQALYEYYPAALEAFDDWTMPATWAFIERFSTPEVLAKAGRGKWNAFLHTHKLYRPATYEKRMEIFGRADQFCGSAAVTKAKSMLAISLAKQLRVLQAQLDGYLARIEELFDQHPDHDLFGSLPAAAGKMAPRLLSEFGDDRDRFEGPEGAQCLAGTAPVTYQSGQMHKCCLSPRVQQTLSRGHAPMGQPQSCQVRLGASLLPSQAQSRDEPSLCAALSWSTLDQDHLQNARDRQTIRRSLAHA